MSEKFKFHYKLLENQFIKYISSAEIKALTVSLGNLISTQYHKQDLTLICLLKGPALFFADLVREIKFVQLTTDFVLLDYLASPSLVSGADNRTLYFHRDITENIFNRNVIIVDQVIDSGRSLYFLKNRLNLAQPKSLKLLTLFDKPTKRMVPLQPDFVGKTLPDHFIIGHGLDLEEFGRNLEDIYFLKYPN
jgi:hypoxanthine phosphoribosyltransferase